MSSFREIERKVTDLLCPGCGTCTIDLTLDCGSFDQECLTVASCRQCGRKFDAGVLPTFQERFEALQREVDGQTCPLCSESRRRVRSLCDRVAKQCFFLLACEACGDVRLA